MKKISVIIVSLVLSLIISSESLLLTKTSAWGLEEHQELTTKSYQLYCKKNQVSKSKSVLRSLKAGSLLNDIYFYNIPSFALTYLIEGDSFINQSHGGGSLQAMHSMKYTGSLEENKKMEMAWISFLLDVILNQDSIENLNLYNYVSEQDVYLKKIIYPIFITEKSFLKSIKNKNVSDVIEKIDKLVQNPKKRSRYANLSVKDFFDDESNPKLDFRLVAMGSLAHTLQDSFVRSHSKRTVDTNNYSKLKDHNLIKILKSDDSEILSMLTPIMSYLDSASQDSSFHAMADNFVGAKKMFRLVSLKSGRFRKTRNVVQATLVVSKVFDKLIPALDNPEKQYEIKEDVLNFVDKVLTIDENALVLEKVSEQVMSGTDYCRLSETVFRGIGINSMLTGPTDGGRQFEDRDWIDNETNSISKDALQEYARFMKNTECDNKIYTKEEILKHYFTEVSFLKIAMVNAETYETKDIIRKHLLEMILEIGNIRSKQFCKLVSEIKSIIDI